MTGRKKVKVLFLLPYPQHKAPSQRFRVDNLLHLLDDEQMVYTIRTFLTMDTWQVLYKGGSAVRKGLGIVKGFLRRLYTTLFEVPQYDMVFIHREAAPLGPPLFEWIIAKLWGKKIIYDFDDAIWIPKTSQANSIATKLKATWKVGKICKWAHVVTVGNDYLGSYAAKHLGQSSIVKIPTVVDTVNRYNCLKQHQEGVLTIGWTGSHSTLFYLDSILPVIRELQESLDFCFLVIADKKPALDLKNWKFIPWNEQTEIADLAKIDIGIMPLLPDEWSEGKCGFKLIQYMALGIPAVSSDVGVNNKIIDHKVNGFICHNDDDWKSGIVALYESAALRREFGAAAREKIVREYSITSIASDFRKVFLS